MPTIPALTTFTANTLAKAAEVNSNFGTIRTTLNTYGLFADVAASISAVHTYSATPVYTAGATFTTAAPTFGAGLTVSGGGASVTGGLTVATGGASVAGGLTVSSGGAAITGNSTVTGNLTVTGTVSGTLTANVPAANVTAGTFSGLFTFANAVTLSSALTLSGSLSLPVRTTAVDWTGTVTATLQSVTGRFRLTGNTTVTVGFAGGGVSSFALVYVTQDGAGGRTLTWSNVTWGGGVAPTQTSTAGRGDLYLIYGLTASEFVGVRLAADLAL